MIKLENVSFKYGENLNLVLKNVSFVVEEKSFVAILGHNGSGKSTLSKIISGINNPTEGKITLEVAGKKVSKISSKVGVVFQNPDNQFIGSTVEDDIAFGLENKQKPREEMIEVVKNISKRVGMEKFLEREPQNLSGGQKQRVAIASILALDPEVIIFDEVTSMLDNKGREEVFNIIKEIKNKREKILISITHDMEEAILADKVLVMSEGKVIGYDSPKVILRDEKIIKQARISKPFIYSISEKIYQISPTYDEEEFLKQIWKLK